MRHSQEQLPQYVQKQSRTNSYCQWKSSLAPCKATEMPQSCLARLPNWTEPNWTCKASRSNVKLEETDCSAECCPTQAYRRHNNLTDSDYTRATYERQFVQQQKSRRDKHESNSDDGRTKPRKDVAVAAALTKAKGVGLQFTMLTVCYNYIHRHRVTGTDELWHELIFKE